MKWLSGLSAVLAPVAYGAAAPVRAQDAVELKVGDKAPDFKLVGTDGKTYSLKDYAGRTP